MLVDMSHCPCEIHQKPIGECGCPIAFIDPDWLEQDALQSARRFGAEVARAEDEAFWQAFTCQEPPDSDTIRAYSDIPDHPGQAPG